MTRKEDLRERHTNIVGGINQRLDHKLTNS